MAPSKTARPTRTPIAMSTDAGLILVLCDDATVWQHRPGHTDWSQLAPIPGTQEAKRQDGELAAKREREAGQAA